MLYVVLLTLLTQLLVICQALPQSSAETGENGRLTDWLDLSNLSVEDENISPLENSPPESGLRSVKNDDVFADRAEVVAAFSHFYNRHVADEETGELYETQIFDIIIDEYKGSKLVRRTLNGNYVDQSATGETNSIKVLYHMPRTYTQIKFLPYGAI